ncbi:MAG: DUF4238 domain-containing protein [Dissulfurispiraceae bacterium]
MKKRGQHYVWRYYLKAWAVDDQIFCLRKGKIFKANLTGVAKERDFYRLKKLSSEEKKFIKEVAIKHLPEESQKVSLDLIEQFTTVLNDGIEEDINNSHEDLHSRIESSAIDHINSIQKGEIGFFNTIKGFESFMYFLCVQSLRTKQMKSRVLTNVTPPPNVDMENIWNVLSLILATNLTRGFLLAKDSYQMVLLDNRSSVQLITGDQPVVNTYFTGNPKNPPEKLEFYYPISPTIAILVTEDIRYKGIINLPLNSEEVSAYNGHIIGNALDQIYAFSEESLERYKQR